MVDFMSDLGNFRCIGFLRGFSVGFNKSLEFQEILRVCESVSEVLMEGFRSFPEDSESF